MQHWTEWKLCEVSKTNLQEQIFKHTQFWIRFSIQNLSEIASKLWLRIDGSEMLPKSFQNASKMLQGAPKMLPNCIQSWFWHPKLSQNDPKLLQDAPKVLPRCFQGVQDAPKIVPRCCQDAPTAFKMMPTCLQIKFCHPKLSQICSNTVPKMYPGESRKHWKSVLNFEFNFSDINECAFRPPAC